MNRIVGLCVVCGNECSEHRNLCKKCSKEFVYDKKYKFFRAKSRRQISKGQTKLKKILIKIYKTDVLQEVLFDWTYPHLYRYDCVVMKKNLICEFDGRQHKYFTKHFHKSVEQFEQQKQNDKHKEQLAKENGFLLVRFDYKEYNDMDVEFVSKKINYYLNNMRY